ncbi:MAG: Co2+/Mg2+ efflux protein ApaG [Gammaproteobacteria bacterium RIFCSPHIGHO2_12_FULL_43_28]|nr:MAG: Co2+/Mg2+ efflux protein ApaG [Gammaproteobacteria bacterium RIFCSPHIGHO2_12_FULL_43_28]
MAQQDDKKKKGNYQRNEKIIITSRPHYVLEQSDPPHQKFVWSYDITILNESDEIIQLLHRFWKITDLSGKVEEIHGAGVIGLQPVIKPGKSFSYTSYCQLLTPQGTMEGFYEIQNLDEVMYIAEIPKFVLTAPTAITKTYRSRLH